MKTLAQIEKKIKHLEENTNTSPECLSVLKEAKTMLIQLNYQLTDSQEEQKKRILEFREQLFKLERQVQALYCEEKKNLAMESVAIFFAQKNLEVLSTVYKEVQKAVEHISTKEEKTIRMKVKDKTVQFSIESMLPTPV